MLQRNVRAVHSRIITPAFVELKQDTHLYCALCRTFHASSNFSGGAQGQRRLSERYCLEATASDRRNFQTIMNMEPTDEGKLLGAKLCGYSGVTDVAPAPTAASQRAARNEERLGAAVDGADLPTARPRREQAFRPRRNPRRASARATPIRKKADGRSKQGLNVHASMVDPSVLDEMWVGNLRYRDRIRVPWTNPHRGGIVGGGAVDLQPCSGTKRLLVELDLLRREGVLREPKPRKLQLTCGAVELVTSASTLVQAGKLICGQAAIVAFTGYHLEELGIERWPPSTNPAHNLLTYGDMNELLASASGLGRAFILRKPMARLTAQWEVFERRTGVYVLIVYHVPGDEDLYDQVGYGIEVMGLRSAHPCLHAPHARAWGR